MLSHYLHERIDEKFNPKTQDKPKESSDNLEEDKGSPKDASEMIEKAEKEEEKGEFIESSSNPVFMA